MKSDNSDKLASILLSENNVVASEPSSLTLIIMEPYLKYHELISNFTKPGLK